MRAIHNSKVDLLDGVACSQMEPKKADPSSLRVPIEVMAGIQRGARMLWPLDETRRAAAFETQCAAYTVLSELDDGPSGNGLVQELLRQARTLHYENFSEQLRFLNLQLEAAAEFFGFRDAGLPDATLKAMRNKVMADIAGDNRERVDRLRELVSQMRVDAPLDCFAVGSITRPPLI